MKDKYDEVRMETMPIIHPHRIITYLFDTVKLKQLDEDVVQFWQHAKHFGEGWSLHTTSTEHHVPLGIFGDGAQLVTQFKKEKLIGIF